MKSSKLFYSLIALFGFGFNQMSFSVNLSNPETVLGNSDSGFFEYTVGEKTGKLEAFEEGYTDITITEDQLAIRVKGSSGVNFLITLQFLLCLALLCLFQ